MNTETQADTHTIRPTRTHTHTHTHTRTHTHTLLRGKSYLKVVQKVPKCDVTLSVPHAVPGK